MRDTIFRNDVDSNLYDAMNGSPTINYKEYIPLDLKGAFANLNGNYGNTNSSVNVLYSRLLFIHQKKNELIGNIMENWDYEGLPDEINKYELEYKLLSNGVGYFIKPYRDLYFVNASYDEVDLYNNPIDKIIVAEPNSFLDKVEIDKFAMMRNNIGKENVFVKSVRFINAMEKVIYELEKNITASAPKGLIVNNGMKITTPDNSDKSDSLNSIVNGENTFYELTLSPEDEGNIFSETKQIYIPMELRDRTEELIKNYNFYNNLLKEIWGAGTNLLEGKAERLITGEIDTQQQISDLNLAHLINIRKADLERVNKIFNLNISITIREEEIQDEMRDMQPDLKTGGENNQTER